jgi:hypothetical protein
MSGQMGYRRIYGDSTGTLHAGNDIVFGASKIVPNAGDNAMEYEDFGLEMVEDDLGAMDYASLGAMDYASLGEDDDDDEDDYDDFGARKRKARRYRRRGRRRLQRPKSARATQVVQKTLLVGQSGLDPGVNFTVTIRPQFDFVAEDLTLNANDAQLNAAGFGIQSIEFGDRIIFSNAQNVPLAVFGTGSFVRGLVKGAAIAAGLDITITGGAGAGLSTTTSQLTAVFTGLKRGTTGCGPGAV